MFNVYTTLIRYDPQYSPALPKHGVQEPVAPTIEPMGPLEPQRHVSPSLY